MLAIRNEDIRMTKRYESRADDPESVLECISPGASLHMLQAARIPPPYVRENASIQSPSDRDGQSRVDTIRYKIIKPCTLRSALILNARARVRLIAEESKLPTTGCQKSNRLEMPYEFLPDAR